MKLQLRIISALMFAAAFCAGQGGNSPASGAQVPVAVPNTSPDSQPQVKPAEAKPVETPPAESKSVTEQPAPPTSVPATPDPAPPKANAPAAAGNTGGMKPYVIGPLDVLEIKVWNDQRLSGIFDVGPDGMISLHLIGPVKADGLTVAELTAVVKERLSATLVNNPEVNIQVARILSKKYFVLGGVFRQGEFPLVGEMRVLDAFASCGGFKDFANPKKIYIMRGTERFKFNYKEVSQGKKMEQNIVLQNGDHIFVPE